MKLDSIVLDPVYWVVFTKADVGFLLRGAIQHYDFDCRHAAERSGLIGRIRASHALNGSRLPVRISFRELDLLSKITEYDQRDRHIKRLHETIGRIAMDKAPIKVAAQNLVRP